MSFSGGLSDDSDVDILTFALSLVQAAVKVQNRTWPLWLLTRGSQPHASGTDEQCVPTHAGLWGFARTVRTEYPDFRISCLDLAVDGGLVEGGVARIFAAPHTELAVRNGTLRDCHLVRSSVPIQRATRLNMPARGALTNLRQVPQERRPVEPNSVQLRIRAVGLNFRDVLNVMGLYPGDPGMPGADCAGTVVELGEGVQNVRLADDVFGEAPGCLSTYSLAPAALITQKPLAWSFEAAAAMPVIFVTVEESLGDIACLKKGERVLVHAAAGGVGLVAIQYAKYVGAEVIATAGSKEKHDYLHSIGVQCVASSRDGDRFEKEMREFFEQSGSEGVDVILNSLSHDDYIKRSLSFLRKGGRFMEIGKRGVWTDEEMSAARPDVLYRRIAADTMMEQEPWRYNAYLQRLLERVQNGGLEPIHSHTFEGFERGVAALQFLQRAQNIGKVIISEPSRLMCRPDVGAMLSGGTGALGLVTAKCLVEEGAKQLFLLSRGGLRSTDSQSRWPWLEASTAAVSVLKCDISREESVLSLKDSISSEITCLMHLSGVLADSMIPSMTREHFEKSYGPKVHGLLHLRKLLGDSEASVLLFSSTSALFGSPGQGNYAAANAVLDSMAHKLCFEGHRARTIQWGPWAEAGMAVETNAVARLKASGMGSLRNVEGMVILGSILRGADPTVGAVHVSWPKFLRVAYTNVPPFLKKFEAEAKRAVALVDSGGSVSDTFATLQPEARFSMIQDLIRTVARDVVGSDELEIDVPLLESGLDSLAGVEFRNRLLTEFSGIRIPNSAVFDYPTVGELSRFVDSYYANSTSTTSPVVEAPVEVAAPAEILELLNGRSGRTPLFLVPGAGMQAGGFRPLANMLPVPVYGISWPKFPREEWPSTLEGLAKLLLKEVRAVSAGPFFLGGHSFGCTVCLEMARLAEADGEQVALVVLLDPRSLPPIKQGTDRAFQNGNLSESLALLSSADGGARYSDMAEEILGHDRAAQDSALRSRVSPAVLASLEHVHQTSQWYSGLLDAASEAAVDRPLLVARRMLFSAEESWREVPSVESRVEMAVREFQAAVFQSNEEVAKQAVVWCGGADVPITNVAGAHFTMLHEPHVVSTALRLSHALVEAGAAESGSARG